MASLVASFLVSPSLMPNPESFRPRCRVLARSDSGGADPVVSSLESAALNGNPPAPAPVAEKEERNYESLIGGNGYLGPTYESEDEKLTARTKEKKREGHRRLDDSKAVESLQVLWDDGYGSASVKDYLDASKEMIKPDGGPPRWFCPVECGQPLKDSPVLLFLPGNFAFSPLSLACRELVSKVDV